MKNKFLFLTLLVSTIFTFTSCSYINDKKIDIFENSIERLDAEYKEMSADELEKAIKHCEELKEYLTEKKGKFSKEQANRFANLKGRYQKVLLEIEVYTRASEVESTLQYIKGLLTNE